MKINPTILLVAADPSLVRQVDAQLHARYANSHRILKATTAANALDGVRDLRAQRAPLALIISASVLADDAGATLFGQIENLYPGVHSILIATEPDTEETLRDSDQTGSDMLPQPLGEHDQRFQKALGGILDRWNGSVSMPLLLVKGIMTVRCPRIREEASLHTAAEFVALAGSEDLMVIDRAGHFVGTLSGSDIVRAALPNFDEIIDAGSTMNDAYRSFLVKGLELTDKPIQPFIVRDPLVLHPDDPIAKAAVALEHEKVNRLPVLRGRELMGTVSRADICQAVVGTLSAYHETE